jgi:hypothetical protein
MKGLGFAAVLIALSPLHAAAQTEAQQIDPQADAYTRAVVQSVALFRDCLNQGFLALVRQERSVGASSTVSTLAGAALYDCHAEGKILAALFGESDLGVKLFTAH